MGAAAGSAAAGVGGRMQPQDLVPALAVLAILTRELLWLAAAAILVSGIDDLAMDALWLAGVAGRRQAVPPPPARPMRLAILVPAWDESAVIAAMLRRLLDTQAHPDFTIFVGTYPNDPATAAAVRSVADPRVRLAVGARPGPTTKADCLNGLWQALLAAEAEAGSGERFDALLLHDAEDVVHPHALDLIERHLAAGAAMVQLPVLPLPDPHSRWVAGHYLDEFAETHARDMMVRGRLGAPLPSAGVGTAIGRDWLERLAGAGAMPFDSQSLTEDYELGHRLHALGGKSVMVRARVDGELVATRAFFPATLEAAVRQKARWLTGIALDGWDRLGWPGDWRARWMLIRDRKGLLTSGVAMIAYATALLVVGQLAVRAMLARQAGVDLPPLLGPDARWLAILLGVNAGLLGWRLLMRAAFTGWHHGPAEALRAIPRAVLANAINFLAARRALERYRALVERGTPPAWDKTAHRFPEGAAGVPANG